MLDWDFSLCHISLWPIQLNVLIPTKVNQREIACTAHISTLYSLYRILPCKSPSWVILIKNELNKQIHFMKGLSRGLYELPEQYAWVIKNRVRVSLVYLQLILSCARKKINRQDTCKQRPAANWMLFFVKFHVVINYNSLYSYVCGWLK